MKNKSDLERLEDAKVTFGEHAFAPTEMYCDKCGSQMKRADIEMPVSDYVKVKLKVFICSKCREEMLGLNEAKKLDRALVINRLLSQDYPVSFKRRLSFDGDNYIFRLPSELTKGKHTEVKIIPLESNEALIRW
ncbi:hypothetical protein HYX00_03280 [Candidatus Woesearchaeota archaeon]|nr:hypothetical protein [Candidatus Woesearchaeota archaeon]